MKTSSSDTYSHTQKAPLCLLLYALAVSSIAFAWAIGDQASWVIGGSLGILLLATASGFHHLTVEDQGDALAIRFGPFPVFQRTVRYADMRVVRTGRTTFLDGWGVHTNLRGTWTWNLWGFDCVIVELNRGKLQIGTDDADRLAEFLDSRIAEESSL